MSVLWGAVNRPKRGQNISGDAYVAKQISERYFMVSVIDGLGGGEEAAEASRNAVAVIERHPEHPLDELVRQAHMALRSTRGAVMALLRLDLQTRKVYYIGVGNIGVYVYSSHSIKPISKNGILGYRLPTLLQLDYSYNSGDTFVLYSDGISSRFSTDTKIDNSKHPQALATTILETYGKLNDDATVVVARDG